MANFVTLVPWVDLTWIRLITQIVNSTVKPVTIAIDMELIEVTEFVEWVVLEVVDLDLILLCGLRLIIKPVLGDKKGRFEWDMLSWIHHRVDWLFLFEVSGHTCALLTEQSFHSALH